jgi:tRNA (uracil-5-)-methyltransferase TRM9
MASISIEGLARAYDRYFATGGYERRYPGPNPATLARSLAAIAEAGPRVIDFGCGSGRYTRALLERSTARIIGYDVSDIALARLRRHCARHVESGRLLPVGHSLEGLAAAAAAQGGIDLVLMLFGVLGHIPGRNERRHTLRALRAMLRPGGRLLVSVPNARRRFLREQATRRAEDEMEPGDIAYVRRYGGEDIRLYYHLYDQAELEGELATCRYRPLVTWAESVLPEPTVARSAVAARVDRLLGAMCPVGWAYGFLTLAEARSTPG